MFSNCKPTLSNSETLEDPYGLAFQWLHDAKLGLACNHRTYGYIYIEAEGVRVS